MPSGAVCTFNPPSIAGGSGKSTLTISTTTSTPAGTYAIQVTGIAGATTSSATASLVVQAAPDFSMAPASGSPTSQTINPGQAASFSLALASSGSFTGTVSLSCAVTPVVTPAPSCTLSSSSVQMGSGSQTVSVKVGTTAPVTTGILPHVEFPPAAFPLAWIATLLAIAWLGVRNRRRRTAVSVPLVALALVLGISCGGGAGPSTHTTPGTPAGTYSVTVTGTSGSLSHNTALQVTVQ